MAVVLASRDEGAWRQDLSLREIKVVGNFLMGNWLEAFERFFSIL